MKLKELAFDRRTKIIDTSELLSDESLVRELYSCRNIDNVNEKPIEKWIDILRFGESVLTLPENYSIKEVGEELEILLNIINSMVGFYVPKTGFFTLSKKANPKFARILRRKNEFKQKRLDPQNEYFYSEGKSSFKRLKLLGDEINRLRKKVFHRDITKKFSKAESQLYTRFSDYFDYVSVNHQLKKDFSSVYCQKLNNRNPCGFGTDQKIVSAALTLSLNREVIIISSDSDLKRMLCFYNYKGWNKDKFGLEDVCKGEKISLYADYKRTKEYELQDINEDFFE